MGVLAYLRNTLRKGSSKSKEGSARQHDNYRDSYYHTSSSGSNSRTRQNDFDTTDDDVDGWDFGARQTPDRSMHSTTPSSFAASRVLLNDASRSSSAQSWHPTKPTAEVKHLPPTPSDFEAEIEFYRRGANTPSTSDLEQMVSKEIANQSGTRVDPSSAPGRALPHEGVVLVAAGTIAKETRLADEKSTQRRKRAQSVVAAAAAAEAPRPVLRHMSSAYTVKDAERRRLAVDAAMNVPPMPTLVASSSTSSGSSSSTVHPGPGEQPSSSSPSPPSADAHALGASYKPRHTMLKAKRSMPQLEGVWEHFLEETAEDASALHARRDGASAGAIRRPPIRRSSKQNLLEEVSWQSESPTPPSVSRPPLPRHSSCPSTSSNLTIASVSSSKFSPSLSSLEMQEIIDGPRSPLPPHVLASSGSAAVTATPPTAPPSQRTIHQRRKHRSSNLMRISNPTSLSSTSSMTGSTFSSMGFSFDRDRMSVSTMTTVQDDDETEKLDNDERGREERTRDSDLFSPPPDQRVPRRLPEDLRIIPELYSRNGSPSHQHHSSQSYTRQMRNGTPSPSSILSFASQSNPNAGRYARGPGSSTTCESSPALTPVGTPTPTTASFPITPPLSRSSSRSTPHLRQRRPSASSQAGGTGQGVSPAARNAIVWQRTPPLYPQELPTDGDEDEGDIDVDTLYFGFPRTPSSSKMILPQQLPSSGGRKSGESPVQLRRHMQRPSISDSSSEEQHGDLSYLRSPPVHPRKDIRNPASMRSKSTTNLRHTPAVLEDQGSMFTTSKSYRSSARHPPLPPPPNALQFDSVVPQRSPPRNVQVARPPPSRRTRSDSDAMTPYSSSSASSSVSLSLSSQRSSPLRHPMDVPRTFLAGSGSPARSLPQRSPLSRSVDLPPNDRPSFEAAPPHHRNSPTRIAGKPVEWGYAV
ncbi:hypothetical protein SCHPADRAFT_934981 [Schizopora paradoxa]|uniref:Uncharacterized protein n=1 Tax=Schizopora paradoxa TaxID=27342 RepID=A0A0H2S6C9_9AGAM|nr:hypothetical protein SCHPADRAFT_934981 [Schizopora paradoxa]